MDKNFLWGGATAANQMEGAYNVGGKGLSSNDVMTGGGVDKSRRVTFVTKDGKEDSLAMEKLNELPKDAIIKIIDGYSYPNHDAIDFYHHYKEDIKLFSKLGINSLRLSLAWSRIFPLGYEDDPNEEGLMFYDAVFKELKKYKIEPVVTLSHYETPLGLTNKWNSWCDRRTIDCFIKYCRVVFERYQNDVKYWLTFNEINCITLGSWGGFLAGGIIARNENDNYNAAHYQLIASAKAVKLAHEINSNLKVGCMLEYAPVYSFTCHPSDAIEANKQMHKTHFYGDVQCRGYYPNYYFKELEKKGISLDITERDKEILKEGCVDYIGFSYYNSSTVSVNQDIIDNIERTTGNLLTDSLSNPYLSTTQWGWTIDPIGLRYALDLLDERYHLPLMIVEIGLGAIDKLENNHIHDDYRIDFLKNHIEQVKLAIEEDGVNCIGIFIWGFIDQVSASTGEMKKRYGMIYVNKNDDGIGDCKRIEKDSYKWYQQVIKTNGEEL